MELVYAEDTPNAQYHLMAVHEWPYARMAQPGDRALFWCEKPGEEKKGWVLWAPIPKGVVKLLVASSKVKHRQLLIVGEHGRVAPMPVVGTFSYMLFNDPTYKPIAQALQDGSPGDLIWAYWLGG